MKLRSEVCSWLAAGLVPILTSCATGIPEQTYLKQGSLANVRKIVVLASADDVKVRGDNNLGNSFLGLLFGVVGLAVDWSVSSAVDSQRTATIQPGNEKQTVAERLSRHFIKSVAADRRFDSVEEASMDAKGAQATKAFGNYDALLRLKVTEASLRQVRQNEWSLFLEISADMRSLRDGREGALLWSRHERMTTGDPHELEYYRTQMVPVLDASLSSLSKRLANDLVYSR